MTTALSIISCFCSEFKLLQQATAAAVAVAAFRFHCDSPFSSSLWMPDWLAAFSTLNCERREQRRENEKLYTTAISDGQTNETIECTTQTQTDACTSSIHCVVLVVVVRNESIWLLPINSHHIQFIRCVVVVILIEGRSRALRRVRSLSLSRFALRTHKLNSVCLKCMNCCFNLN